MCEGDRNGMEGQTALTPMRRKEGRRSSVNRGTLSVCLWYKCREKERGQGRQHSGRKAVGRQRAPSGVYNRGEDQNVRIIFIKANYLFSCSGNVKTCSIIDMHKL